MSHTAGNTCCHSVRLNTPFARYRACGRPAKVMFGGKHYCGIHDPKKRNERQAVRDAERAAEFDARMARARLHNAAPKLLEALQSLLKNHVQLVSCGDCGNWDVETEPAVVAARAALSAAGVKS